MREVRLVLRQIVVVVEQLTEMFPLTTLLDVGGASRDNLPSGYGLRLVIRLKLFERVRSLSVDDLKGGSQLIT